MISVVGTFHCTSIAFVLIVEERGLVSPAPTLLLLDIWVRNHVC